MIDCSGILAALVQSSLWPGHFRTWGLYWSDGVRDFSLILNQPAEEVVLTAQSMFP
jgi:hypothetical protein